MCRQKLFDKKAKKAWEKKFQTSKVFYKVILLLLNIPWKKDNILTISRKLWEKDPSDQKAEQE